MRAPPTRAAPTLVPALVVALGLAGACATPVGVRAVDEARAQRALTANVLSEGEPSSFSKAQLLRLGLWTRYQEDPDAALEALRGALGGPFDEPLLFALAELSFHRAQRGGPPGAYLAAAVYAYAYLFPEGGEVPGAFDPRVSLALQLYDHGLAEGFAGEDPRSVELRGGRYALTFGSLDVERDPDGFDWDGYQLGSFTSLYGYEVRGLRNRYRRPGLGAALAASLVGPEAGRAAVSSGSAAPEAAPPRAVRVPPRLKMPVTAVLTIEDPRAAVASGRVRGRLNLYVGNTVQHLELGGRRVPLEYDPSGALALSFDEADIWTFEKRGFLSGAYRQDLDGIYALGPYRPGRVPVVLVHGTASSPGRWAQMLNELVGDPLLNERCQFWLFVYNTGNPILYSTLQLRDALNGAVEELDPAGRDPALRRMVVIGHSQGGLLTRLVVTDSGDRFWNAVFRKPLDELDLGPEARDLLQRGFFFEPVPSVERVVFIATPHAGSFLAARRLGALASRLVRMPFRLAGLGTEVLTQNADALAMRRTRMASSVDNMNPDSPFSRALATSPFPPGVKVHSIIPVKRDRPPWSGADDGVVAYDSAHLGDRPGVVSERVVHSGHSTQGTPEVVRRILREHVQQPERSAGVAPHAARARIW